MPDSNLFSLFASASLKIPVIWGFRSSNIEIKNLSLFSKLYFYAQKLFSPKAAAIICNSNHAIDFYQNINNDTKDNIIPLSAGMDTLLSLSNNFRVTNLPVYFLIEKKSSFKFIQISKIIKF